MELLYSKIQNPLKDESAMYKVFLSYSKSANDNPYVGRSIYTLKSNRWDRENKTGKWYSCVSADVYSYKYKFMDKEHMFYESINNSINRFNFSISACAKDIEDIMYKTKDEMGINR